MDHMQGRANRGHSCVAAACRPTTFVQGESGAPLPFVCLLLCFQSINPRLTDFLFIFGSYTHVKVRLLKDMAFVSYCLTHFSARWTQNGRSEFIRAVVRVLPHLQVLQMFPDADRARMCRHYHDY